MKETLPLSLAVAPACARAIEKQRLFHHVRHNGGLAGRDDLAGDSFAQGVAAALHLVRAEPEGVLDDNGACGPIQDRDRSPQHAHPGGHALQNRTGHLIERRSPRDLFAHFQKKVQVFPAARMRIFYVSGILDGVGEFGCTPILAPSVGRAHRKCAARAHFTGIETPRNLAFPRRCADGYLADTLRSDWANSLERRP